MADEDNPILQLKEGAVCPSVGEESSDEVEVFAEEEVNNRNNMEFSPPSMAFTTSKPPLPS